MHDSRQEELHRAEASKLLSSEGRKYFKFIEFDANEELITEIRKHPFGLFLIYLTGLFVVLAVTIINIVALSSDLSWLTTSAQSAETAKGILALVSFFIIIGDIIVTFIAAFLFKSNVIYVTSEKLAQVLYTSLFNRKISQLSIGDVQDVTVTQKGIFAHIFKFGTLVIETAGEQQNYTFSFVPNPYETSTAIVGAHERNLKEFGN